MLDINAVERVLDERYKRSASDESLIGWLEHLKKTTWKFNQKVIDGFIKAIQQTPNKDN
jgi:hypothetical protein